MAVWWNAFGFGEAQPFKLLDKNLSDAPSPKEKVFAFDSNIFAGKCEIESTRSLSVTGSWGRSASVRVFEYAALCHRLHRPNLFAVCTFSCDRR